MSDFLLQESIETMENYKRNRELGILHLSDIYNKRKNLIN